MKARHFEHTPGGIIASLRPGKMLRPRKTIPNGRAPSPSRASNTNPYFDPHLVGLLRTSNAGERASRHRPAFARRVLQNP
jgi:hypothetical protein